MEVVLWEKRVIMEKCNTNVIIDKKRQKIP